MGDSVTETKPTEYTILWSVIVLCVQGVQYLVQVGMCLDKDTLKVISCPSGPSGSCRPEESVIYAPSIYV